MITVSISHRRKILSKNKKIKKENKTSNEKGTIVNGPKS